MTAHEQSHGWSVDGQLVDAAIAGDQGAFREIVLRFDPGLRGLAFRLLRDRDRMDDVVHEAYLKTFRALPGLDIQFRTGLHLRRTFRASENSAVSVPWAWLGAFAVILPVLIGVLTLVSVRSAPVTPPRRAT